MNATELLDAVGTIRDAPEGIERLRQLVLQLAVRGFLVPQDPNDEPAVELLKGIAHRRNELAQRHGLRRQAELPKVQDSEVRWQAPAGWAWTRVGAVTASCTGGTPSRGRSDYFTGTIPWVKSGELGDGYVTESSEAITEEALASSSAKLLPVGTVCIALYGATVGRVGVMSIEACTNQAVCSLFPPDGLDRHYLFWFLRSIRDHLIGQSQGGAQPNISNGLVRETQFPLPPLAEQRRIVAKVDELMALLDDLERARDDRDARRTAFRDSALAALQNAEDAEAARGAWSRIAANIDDLFTDPADIAPLRQTILQLAVRGRLIPQNPNDEPASKLVLRPLTLEETSDDPELPSGWCYVRFGDLGEVHGGSTPSKRNADYWNGDVPWVTPKDMKRDIITESIDTLTNVALSATTIRLVPIESLIMVVRGMILSHSFPTARTAAPVTLNQDMKAIVLNDTRLLPYLHLATKGMKPRFLSLVEHSTHGTCKLKSERLFGEPIPLPPLAEQHRIVAKVDVLMTICDELEQRLTEAKTHQSAFAAGAVHHLDLAGGTRRQSRRKAVGAS